MSFDLSPSEIFLKNTKFSGIDEKRVVLLEVVKIVKCHLAVQLIDMALYAKLPWPGNIE